MLKKISIFLMALFVFAPLVNTVPVYAAVTTSESDNSNELQEVENLVGHYQFNVAAGSNINSNYLEDEEGREYSHLTEMKKYEHDHSEKLKGNSSGCLLDGSYNEGGSIHSAYLIIETSTSDLALPDYPITFVSEKGNVLESKVEKYCFEKTYSSGNDRRSGYINVTDFVKENGYGMYYVCNIPFNCDDQKNGNDEFAGWKLIVIEENESIPIRILKLKIGSQSIGGKGQSTTITVNGEGIRTAKAKEVTGQFLYGMSGADFCYDGGQYNSISYGYGVDKINDSDFRDINETTGIRTKNNPLCEISTRNGMPLKTVSGFEHPRYIYSGSIFSEQQPGGFETGSGDLELLDINEDGSKYHDVSIAKDQGVVSFKFETVEDVVLMASAMGIAIDIDVPVYEHSYTMRQNEDEGTFVIEGEFQNVTELFDIGLKNPYFVMEYDKDLKLNSCEVRLTSLGESDEGKEEKVITMNDIKVDEQGHKLMIPIEGVGFSGTSDKVNMKNDKLFYKLTFKPSEWKDAYDSRIYATGNLFSSKKDTGMNIDKVALQTISASQDAVETKVDIKAKVVWNDAENKDKKRPKQLTVYLTNDSVPIKPQKLKGKTDTWEFEYNDQPIYRDMNTQIIYGVGLDEDDKLGEYKKDYDVEVVKTSDNSFIINMNYKGLKEKEEKVDIQKLVDFIKDNMGIGKIVFYS